MSHLSYESPSVVDMLEGQGELYAPGGSGRNGKVLILDLLNA